MVSIWYLSRTLYHALRLQTSSAGEKRIAITVFFVSFREIASAAESARGVIKFLNMLAEIDVLRLVP
jgi:hypothetical protein